MGQNFVGQDITGAWAISPGQKVSVIGGSGVGSRESKYVYLTDEDSGVLEIVDPSDESRKSSKENSGKELARYLHGHSTIVKRNLCALPQFTEEDALLQISGSMSTDLCQGQFSNYKDTITIKAFGFNLSFSRDYLDTIRAMTGCDIRQCAYKIEMAGPGKSPIRINSWLLSFLIEF